MSKKAGDKIFTSKKKKKKKMSIFIHFKLILSKVKVKSHYKTVKSIPQEWLCKKGGLSNFPKFTGKHLPLSPLFN